MLVHISSVLIKRKMGLQSKILVIRKRVALSTFIWVSGVIVMLGLTIKDFIPLYNDYKHNNYSPQINISTYSISPNMTICLPYYSTFFWSNIAQLRKLDESYLNGTKSMHGVCFRCDWMKNHSWDYWRNVDLNSDGDIFKYLINRIILEDYPEYNISSFEWLQLPIDAIWYYFRLIYDKDLSVLLDQSIDIPNYLGDSPYGIWYPKDTMDQLYQYILRSVQEMVAGGCTFKSPHGDNYTIEIKSIVQMPSFTILGEHFCFPVPDQFHDKSVECWFNDRLYPWHRFGNGYFQVYDSPAMLYDYSAAFLKQSVYMTDHDKLQGEHPAEHVNLTYDIESRLIANHKGYECTEEPHAEICIIKHQVQTAVDVCGCIPFRFKYLVNEENINLPYCSGISYNKDICQENLRKNLSLAQEGCNAKCIFTFYKWGSRKYSTEDANGGEDTVKRFHVTIRTSKKPYIEFSISQKFSPVQYVTQIGGLLNLYVGVSGLSLFLLLIMVSERIKRWYCKKKQHRSIMWDYLKMISIFHTFGSGQREETQEQKTNGIYETVETLKKDFQDLKAENARMAEKLRIWERQGGIGDNCDIVITRV